jgi:hypothetical protein
MKSLMHTFVWAAIALCVLLAFGQQTGTSRAADSQASQPPSTASADFDKQYAQIQEQLTKMEEEMNKVRSTQDPQERQRLLKEHWATMQTAMTTMHALSGGMMGPGMMGGQVAGRHMMSGLMKDGQMMEWNDYRNLTPEQLKQRQYMMDRSMPIQQIMMDHIMQHQYWMMQPQLPVPSKK